MLNRKLLFLVLACCLLAFVAIGCDDDDDDDNGGNGGNGGGVGAATLSGDAGSSYIQNADVAVLTVAGDVVATTTTDNTGGYTVSIPDDEDGPFLIRVQGTAGQSQLVTVGPDGTPVPEDFIGPWYSLVTADELLGDAPQANVTPLTTIAVWMLRAEAAKAGQIDEELVQDYGALVQNMAANAFMAGLETGGQSFASFDVYTSPALPKGDLSDEDASELVANRAAIALAKDVLSGVGTAAGVGSSNFAGNLAIFGLDLSDGLVDGQVEGFGDDNAAALNGLFTEAVALIPGNGTPTDPADVLTAISTSFADYTDSDIQTALTGLNQTLIAEANTFGATSPAFIVPVVAADSALVANPPAQMILILNPAVVEIPAGQTTSEATSTLNFVVLDGKGEDVTVDYLDKLSAAVVSNGGVSFLAGTETPEPVSGGAGYQVETLPFNTPVNGAPAEMGVDNTATVTVSILGTSLQGQTLDGEDLLVTFVQPTDTQLATAVESASLVVDDIDNISTMTIDLATTTEPVGQTVSGVATLTVDNGWFWTGTIDNVSKSLMGVAFVDGELFDVGYLVPDNVTGTTANVRIDLEDNNNITGLARTPVGGGGILP